MGYPIVAHLSNQISCPEGNAANIAEKKADKQDTLGAEARNSNLKTGFYRYGTRSRRHPLAN
jgi:hypothetical protein